MEKIHQYLIELDTFWNSSSDERYRGENPACHSVQELIEEEFSDMSDREIMVVLDSLPKERLEQLLSVFEDMVDERAFMGTYIRIAAGGSYE